jgi:cystathionine beta-lyase
LRVFKIGYSWAGPQSLAVPYHVQGMRSRPSPYAGVLVRFSIGLEHVDDLIADCEQALAVSGLA